MSKRLVKRGETSGRIDDNEDTIKKRLKTFHEETTPILGYYGKQGKLVTIEANRSKDEVFSDVTQALKDLIDQHQVGKQLAFVFLLYIPVSMCREFSFMSIRFFFQTDLKQNSSNKGIFPPCHIFYIQFT
jgi:hypothetical protein